MVDVELPWECFKTIFIQFIDKHAPLRRYRPSGKDNPWFNENLVNLIGREIVLGSWLNDTIITGHCEYEIKGKDKIINAFNDHFNKATAIIPSHFPVSERPFMPQSVISSSTTLPSI